MTTPTQGMNTYTQRLRVCRFCGHYGENLLKYSVRHYAHAKCGLEAEGAAFFDHFQPWQLYTQFPYQIAEDFGLGEKLEELARSHRG